MSLRLRAEGPRCGTRGVPGRSRRVLMSACVCTRIHTSKQSGTFYVPGQHSSGDWGPGPRNCTDSGSSAAGEILIVHMHINIF